MTSDFERGFLEELQKIAQQVDSSAPPMQTPAVQPITPPAPNTAPAVAANRAAGQNAQLTQPGGPA